MSKAERRASPDPRFYFRRSGPVGRINLRATRKVPRGLRIKPKSWPSRFWFKSELFRRGFFSRRRRFADMLDRARKAYP